MSLKRQISSENVSKIAQISTAGDIGFDVILPSGSTIRQVRSPGHPDIQNGSWVTILKNGSDWQIIGRAAAAPSDPNA